MKIMDLIGIITIGEGIQKVSSAETPVLTEAGTAATVMKDLRVIMIGELQTMDRIIIAITRITEVKEVQMIAVATNTIALTMKETTIVAEETMEAEIMDRTIIAAVMNVASVDGGIRLLTK
jgi:hypothetical protein